jgi:hypothetical protein
MPIPAMNPAPAPTPASSPEVPTPPEGVARVRVFQKVAGDVGVDTREFMSGGLTARVSGSENGVRRAWRIFDAAEPGRAFAQGSGPSQADAEAAALAYHDELTTGRVHPGHPDAPDAPKTASSADRARRA